VPHLAAMVRVRVGASLPGPTTTQRGLNNT
jgi:hypothetical protein